MRLRAKIQAKLARYRACSHEFEQVNEYRPIFGKICLNCGLQISIKGN